MHNMIEEYIDPKTIYVGQKLVTDIYACFNNGLPFEVEVLAIKVDDSNSSGCLIKAKIPTNVHALGEAWLDPAWFPAHLQNGINKATKPSALKILTTGMGEK